MSLAMQRRFQSRVASADGWKLIRCRANSRVASRLSHVFAGRIRASKLKPSCRTSHRALRRLYDALFLSFSRSAWSLGRVTSWNHTITSYYLPISRHLRPLLLSRASPTRLRDPWMKCTPATPDRDPPTLTTSLDVSASPTLPLSTTHLPGPLNTYVDSHVDTIHRC